MQTFGGIRSNSYCDRMRIPLPCRPYNLLLPSDVICIYYYRTSVGRESSVRLLNNGSSKLWGREFGPKATANNNQERSKQNYSKSFICKTNNAAPFPKCCENENGVKHAETNVDGKDVSSTESFFLPLDNFQSC